ncbi:hypothetical protein [Aquipseudomonas alcaligenes]
MLTPILAVLAAICGLVGSLFTLVQAMYLSLDSESEDEVAGESLVPPPGR